MHFLGLSGSLRAASTNTALLRAAAAAAPPGLSLHVYDGLGRLPVFNPDDDTDAAPAAVREFRHLLTHADGVLIACPEYAHGVPGGLKNALDWVVGSSELVDKPVALLHASPRSAVSRTALAEILATMSALIEPEASVTVPLLGMTPDDMAVRLAEPSVRAMLAAGLRTLAGTVARRQRTQSALV